MWNENSKKCDICLIRGLQEGELDSFVAAIKNWTLDSGCIRTVRTDFGLLIDFQGIPPNKEDLDELRKTASEMQMIYASAYGQEDKVCNSDKLTVCWVREVSDDEVDDITVKAIKWSWESEYIRTAKTDSGLLIDFQGIPPNKEELNEFANLSSKNVRLLHESALCHGPWKIVWRNIPD